MHIFELEHKKRVFAPLHTQCCLLAQGWPNSVLAQVQIMSGQATTAIEAQLEELSTLSRSHATALQRKEQQLEQHHQVQLQGLAASYAVELEEMQV